MHYSYTPLLWPLLASTGLTASLAFYGWRRRAVPAALAFAASMLFWSLFGVGAAFELAANDLSIKIFWHKFQFFWQGPAAIAGLWFVLSFARLQRFMTRRNLIALSSFVAVGSLLVLTNDIHHWIWRSVSFDGVAIHPEYAPVYWILIVFGYTLSMLCLPILIWLFIRWPRYRWPVAFILIGQIMVRAALILTITGPNPFAPLNPVVLTSSFLAINYMVALFGFRIFDPVPMANRTVFENIADALLVIDTDQRIVDANPAALSLFAAQRKDHAERAVYHKNIAGRPARQVLERFPAVLLLLAGPPAASIEIQVQGNSAGDSRHYEVRHSPLLDPQSYTLGQLLWFRDITTQKHAQAQLVEQQRSLAMLLEREQVARELHDGLGQILGYVRVQAQAARDWLSQGQPPAADRSLAQLVTVAQDAQIDVREYILGARTALSAQSGFLPALRHYLEQFSRLYSLPTELILPPGWTDGAFEPTVEAQLLRIVQEALTNTRKHAQARHAQVIIQPNLDHARVIIQDDGIGFEPASLAGEERQHYGLEFMRERAAGVGGQVEIHSAPGQGTRVVVDIPCRGPHASTSG